MRKHHYLTGLFALVIMVNAQAQSQSGVDSTGLPGDNFSLQGALAMFQKASSPEDFEKMLNSQDNHVNNLDLNGDGDIDYIRVIDNSKKNAHAIVLQAVISKNESQDIAVIELEKTGDSTAVLQIVGDKDIYGEEVIAEPGQGDDNAFIEPGSTIAHGPNPGFDNVNPRVIVNVWFWPSVRFVYAPMYSPWISPWAWSYYPMWWRPWRPVQWWVWHPYYRPYYAQYNIVHTHRVAFAHRMYTPLRVTSVIVTTRHAGVIGNYRVTRTKTSIVRPSGREPVKVRTTYRGPGGRVKTKTILKRR